MASNRSLSTALKRQLFKPFRDEDIRPLLTLDHTVFAQPYRFVAGDPREFATLTSNGNIYITFPFEITMLSDDDSEPQANLRIQNVDDRLGKTVLGLPNEALSVSLQIVMRDTPDTVEIEVVNMELVDIEITAIALTGRLVLRGSVTEPCPGRRLTNRISPVFFR